MTWSAQRRRSTVATRPADRYGAVVVSEGPAVPAACLDDLVATRPGDPILVVALALMHGTAFGLPNPGLLPTADERAAAERVVASARAALRRRDLESGGLVLVTRSPARAIRRLALAHGARSVTVVETATRVPGLSALSLSRTVRRRLPATIDVRVAKVERARRDG